MLTIIKMGNDCSRPAAYQEPQRCPKHTRNILRHDNVIDYIQNIKIYLRHGNLYIVDIRDIPKNCAVCGPICPNEVRLYRGIEWDDIFGSYDGVTRLPTKIFELNIHCFIFMNRFNVPNFGTLLVASNCIMYNPYKKIDKIGSSFTSSAFMINGELVISCRSRDDKSILVNMDGNIIDMETTNYTYCDSVVTSNTPFGGFTVKINTPYGDFSGIRPHCEYDYRDWRFTGIVPPAPKIRGLRTKPAPREIDYS